MIWLDDDCLQGVPLAAYNNGLDCEFFDEEGRTLLECGGCGHYLCRQACKNFTGDEDDDR